MNIELNCLSYWFPRIQAAGLPVPKTEIVRIPDDVYMAAGCNTGDEAELLGAARGAEFLDAMTEAVRRIGTPCFIRTGQTSGKHMWKHCCYLDDIDNLPDRIANLIDYSECAGLFGLPWNVWAVRELLPTIPLLTADKYGNMPVCREFRYFVADGKVQCAHPYWPHQALLEGLSKPPHDFAANYQAMNFLPLSEMRKLHVLAEQAGKALGGSWSVDILETTRGWYVTDMATATDSFHIDDCPLIPQLQQAS